MVVPGDPETTALAPNGDVPADFMGRADVVVCVVCPSVPVFDCATMREGAEADVEIWAEAVRRAGCIIAPVVVLDFA